MVTRRTLLGGAAAAAVAAPLATWRMSSASAAQSLPLTVTNNTGRFANGSIFVYVVGTELATGRQGFVRNNRFTPAQLSDNGPGGFADLSIPLGANGRCTVDLPRMSGRVYVSMNDKIKFKVVTDGAGKPALQFPAGWVKSDPSFNVLHDCMEFTFNEAGMFCNTTMVDMFSVPMSIALTGAKQQVTGRLKAGGRDRIFAKLAADPVFGKLVVGNTRVIAPGHGIESGIFPANFYDKYIDAVFQRCATQGVSIVANGKTFTGRVTGGTLTFDGGVAPFAKPTTRDVFFCDGKLAAPNDGVTGPVAAMLGAGFNRSTLLLSPKQPITDPRSFYTDKTTNLYSKVMHDESADGKAYGFAFDDILDFAAFILDNTPRSVSLSLDPFGAGAGQPAPAPKPSTPGNPAPGKPKPAPAPVPPPRGGPAPRPRRRRRP